jgi:phenylalanyl-tRNA synthetase beta chain
MRSSLFGGLVANLVTNQRRKQTRVRLFEIGRCFSRDQQGAPVAGFAQPWTLGLLAWGPTLPEQWGEAARRVDFYDVKGDIENLCGQRQVVFRAANHPALHPGRSAWVEIEGRRCGVVGELHPRWVLQYDLATAPVVAELALDVLLPQSVPSFVELSQQPAVVRDLALVVDTSLAAGELLETMQRSRPSLVKDIQLFDLYAGKGVEPGKKSLAFRIVMQDTQKTLQDAEVDAAVQGWVSALEKSVGAKLRA